MEGRGSRTLLYGCELVKLLVSDCGGHENRERRTRDGRYSRITSAPVRSGKNFKFPAASFVMDQAWVLIQAFVGLQGITGGGSAGCEGKKE